MATFWRTFHHDGENSPARLALGVVGGTPLTLSTMTSKIVAYAPAVREDTLPLFLLNPYMYSVGTIL